MKKFLVCAAVFTAMFFMISCGGSDNSSTEDNNGNTEDNSGCTKITPKWTALFSEEDSEEDSVWCQGFDFDWSEGIDYEDVELKEGYYFIMNGSYTPKTGSNSAYDDYIGFSMSGVSAPKDEYDLSSRKNVMVAVYEDLNSESLSEDETLSSDKFSKAYVSVGGTVKIHSFDCKNHKISLSLQNVRMEEATPTTDKDGQINGYKLTNTGKCLVIESSSFEQ